MSKQDKENEVYTRKNQNMLTEAKDNPETAIYENPIKNGAEMVHENKANEDPA